VLRDAIADALTQECKTRDYFVHEQNVECNLYYTCQYKLNVTVLQVILQRIYIWDGPVCFVVPFVT
jgi:hypothetical protein